MPPVTALAVGLPAQRAIAQRFSALTHMRHLAWLASGVSCASFLFSPAGQSARLWLPHKGVVHGGHMRRREFITFLGGAAAAWPLGALAQQRPGKVPRIGFLTRYSDASVSTQIDAFRKGLRELGWVEGKSISIEYRNAEGQIDRLRALKLPNKQPVRSLLLLRSLLIQWGWIDREPCTSRWQCYRLVPPCA